MKGHIRSAVRQQLGLSNGCFIIGEVAQNHDGSLGLAHAFIDAIARAGADAVKFQTHIAEAESTLREPWRVKFSRQDTSRYEYWRRMEFTEEQWAELKKHADDRELAFLSSPFSVEAVELLERVGVAAWKVASGEVGNPSLFERMCAMKKPLLISTGMSTLREVDDTVDYIKASEIPFAIMQCTSIYPTPLEKVGLNIIPLYSDRYQCAVGMSDHSGTVYPGLAATAIGIDVLEVHVTLSREMFGPDVPASITTGELRHLVDGVRAIDTMHANPVDKDAMAAELAPMRTLFGKSVVARHDLVAGTVLAEEHLTLKKPGSGIPAARLREIIGRRLIRDVNRGELLQESDLG